MSKAQRRLEELLGEMRKANQILEGSAGDGGRKAAAIDGQKVIAADLTANDETRELDAAKAGRKSVDQQIDELKELMAKNRKGSKAGKIGAIQPPFASQQGRQRARSPMKAHPFMKSAFRDYEAGELMSAIMDRKGMGYDGEHDSDLERQGKAKLAALAAWGGLPVMSKAGIGVGRVGPGNDPNDPSASGFMKATLGATGATGGYVLPNNLVDSVVKPATQKAVYQQLITTINGVSVRGVDQPYRTSAAQRATFIDWGTTKANVNEAYGTYSANLGTIAIIYDIGKQYARFSAGAAEQDVIDEITRGMVLGENYYIAVGAGTGGVGTGDPTTGFYTALAAAAPTYSTAFSSASNTTQIGSLAEALTVAGRALSTRSREATAWVMDAVTYWTAIGQGTDTAGFWTSPTGYPGAFTRTASGGVSYWGQSLYYDANLNTNAGTSKIIVGGEWDALKLYRGMEFRIDTSDVAGTRWDLNLIGFRGEEEIGIHAGTAVAIGAFQLVTAAIA